RIRLAYHLALARPPEPDEVEDAVAFIGRAKAAARPPARDGDHSGLVDFCHILSNSNEFLYVDWSGAMPAGRRGRGEGGWGTERHTDRGSPERARAAWRAGSADAESSTSPRHGRVNRQ